MTEPSVRNGGTMSSSSRQRNFNMRDSSPIFPRRKENEEVLIELSSSTRSSAVDEADQSDNEVAAVSSTQLMPQRQLTFDDVEEFDTSLVPDNKPPPPAKTAEVIQSPSQITNQRRGQHARMPRRKKSKSPMTRPSSRSRKGATSREIASLSGDMNLNGGADGMGGMARPIAPMMLVPGGLTSSNSNGVGGFSYFMGSIPEEGSDEEDEDPIMEAMDYLEDEIDEHTWDDLIPLHIRMALEDQIFGWDHFLSNILGHVVYTVGSYLLTYWVISYIFLREVPWRHHYGEKQQYTNDDTSEPEYVSRSLPLGIPFELFSFLRTALSVASAVSTYRTIRRRRRVWLRQPYGSVLVGREAQRRRASLEEADKRARSFVLGSKLWAKMQGSYRRRKEMYLTRGVNKKLLKAQRMFERRHRNRVKLIRSTTNSSLIASTNSEDSGSRPKRAVASALTRHGHEESHHERVRILASSGSGKKRRDSDYTSGEEDESVGGSSVGVASFTEDVGYRSFAANRRDSHTLPSFAMESVSHDQMPFLHGEIKNIPYVHGGFFGAAPFMLTNPHWISIMRLLMPDVYVEISKRASYAPAPKLIHWAENNPVVAAYGTAHEIEFSGKVPTLEWDVFLDPYLVKRVEIVLNERDAFLARKKSAPSPTSGDSDETKTSETSDSSNKPYSSTPESSANERLVLSYYNAEILRRTELLVERMLIAHGNVAQLIMEQTGYLKKYNFSRVKRTRKTLGGGIFAKQWLAVFAEAMKLGMGVDDEYDEESDYETDSIGGNDDSDSEMMELKGTMSQESNTTNEGKDVTFSNLDEIDVGSPNPKQDHDSSGRQKVFRTPNNESTSGPPKKIVMMRSKDDDDDDVSTDGSTASESSPQKSTNSVRARRLRRKRAARRRMGPQQVDATSLRALASSLCPDTTISESIAILRPIMQCSAPLGLVLDMKSRHVSRRVWALVIDFLRDAGARVEGIASFFVEEVRDISNYCSTPVNEIVFAHSAGDMQLGCHKGHIRSGDRVFFNAGSLLWDYPDLSDLNVVKNILGHRMQVCFDVEQIKLDYRLKHYARTTRPQQSSPKNHFFSDDESETCGESFDDEASNTSDVFTKLLIEDRKRRSFLDTDFTYEEIPGGDHSTIQDYKNHYRLSIGLYVQEFAIDEAAISLIVKYVNANQHVYDLGLSWGGINGITVKGIQPGRFTATDGLWNQRYTGMPWRNDLKPSDSLEVG